MDDESHSEEFSFSFPKIAQDEVDDGSMNLSRSIWLPYSTTTTRAAEAEGVSKYCSFPTCPHSTEVANHLISITTKEEEAQVEEGRTPRSSATTPKTTVKLPRSPTTTSPRALFPMDSMWEDQEDGSGGVTPSRRRRSLLSGSATPKSFTAEDLAEERMDMLWEEYQEHEELVAMGMMCQFLKKHWMEDDDDDGESSPYTGSHSSSSSSTATSATSTVTVTATATTTNNPGSTPEMIAQLCCAQMMQMSKGGSPPTAVVPLRKPGLRVIFKVLKKLFLLHHSHHHRSSRAKRSSSKVRSSSPTAKY